LKNGADLKLVFSPTSFADLQRINEFYMHINPKIVRQAFSSLKNSFELLIEFPQMGRVHSLKNTRELLVPFGKGNFVIRYEFTKKQINILHIWHSLKDE
jgi:plasmid stabilization system protein ParE